ncbi:phage tail protein I [Ralstonia sp. SM1864_UCD524_TZ4]|uniref:phage tail protein I n=1 Tax=Ralstonia solanacearum species complex TaxID=3116862 RepID=UPI0018D069CE|nr:phage tail protein I [Ralstonia pseudosolanacearum]MDO3521851.1 phage tail protein I [Ralstonia pseudosolanacearum]MDO3547881.1 phage tail protein I [Ralstonia pseudosolanacearum]MDO3551175.1 phage tail protein I [Ralstonia pseudosolanacearum]MDO3566230.1 phage tail protein I [Ralstonia pseudosolanacearum]MDO3580896.1 phage tail protein I [Ralstonia pseudosolanacearum]
MSSATLLPPNATPLERRAAQAGARIERVPVPLRDLWNPATCPAELLPFLAWSFSVDRWNPSWPLATKRAVTAASYFVHRKKGTIGALRRAVEPLGFLIRVIEWWQTNPPGPRGSFRLDVGVLQTGIDEAMYAELERLIDDAKPCSRPMLGLQISLEVRGTQATGAAAYLGDVLTVYPYEPPDIVVSGTAAVSAASHAIDTLTVTQ